MLKNYFTIAWRNLRKSRLTSFINIFGLTISISACLLIALFIYEEVNYDTFEKEYENVYRLEQVVTDREGVIKHWAASPALLKDLLLNKFPEIESSTRLMPAPYAFINVDEKKFKEENCFLADSSVFNVLGLTLLKGDKDKALCDLHSAVISEKMALKLFGNTNVLGKKIDVNASPFKITGVLRDLPETSHLQLTLLRSLMISKGEPFMGNWTANALYSYARLKKSANPALLPDKISTELVKIGFSLKKDATNFKLHNIADIHLDGNAEKELSSNSSWSFVYIFISIGVLVLLLASINYINLTTSRSLERSKEIGVRKTLGAFKKNLVTQFITESVVVTLLSYGIALLVVAAALPAFNTITAKHLSLAVILHPFFILMSLAIIVFIGILAGIYPAFVISSFDPVNTLKGVVSANTQSGFSFALRKGLVFFQFVISAFLVIASLVVIRQINFMFDRPLGFAKQNIMVLPAFHLNDQTLGTMRTSLKNQASITDVSATSAVPGKRVMLGGVEFPGQPQLSIMRTMFVDYNYLKTMNVSLVKGRDFDTGIVSDSATSVIVNEAAVKSFGLKNAIGQKVNLVFFSDYKTANIVGVAADFHQGSLHNSIEPMIFVIQPYYNSMIIRFTGDVQHAKKDVEAAWHKAFPDELFTYSLLDDDLKALYKTESTLKQLLIIFTTLAIIIASLGLFGLIFFSNTLRKKEIGVRKILGAANGNIIYLLSKEYVVLIVTSLAVSVPLSHYALHKWLENFAYRTDISLITYVTGICITLFIALATVLMQGMRSAMASPAKSLRTE